MATTFSKNDLKRIGPSLAAAVLMIAAGAGIAFTLTQQLQAEKKSYAAAQARRAEQQSLLARVRDEEQEIKYKIGRYNTLARRGILGEEQRLDWIEHIRRVRAERRLFEIEYEIAPQQAIEDTILPAATGRFEFRSSSMRMKLPLLHEHDLLDFLGDLGAAAPAFLRTRECNVVRVPKDPNHKSGPPPQLAAECTIDWITIRDKEAK